MSDRLLVLFPPIGGAWQGWGPGKGRSAMSQADGAGLPDTETRCAGRDAKLARGCVALISSAGLVGGMCGLEVVGCDVTA